MALPFAELLPLWPVRSPPRCALNTFTASAAPAVSNWLKLTVTALLRNALYELAAGATVVTLGCANAGMLIETSSALIEEEKGKFLFM